MALSIIVFGNLKLELTNTVAKDIRVCKSSKFERQLREEEGLRLCGYVRHCRGIRECSSLRQARVPHRSVFGKMLFVPPFLICYTMVYVSLKQGRDDAGGTRSHIV
jgi:hypothetical protein